MAEIGLIASVVGIAGAGIKLATTLYTFAETAGGAGAAVSDLARDVSMTAAVLDQLAGLLREDADQLRLSSAAARSQASEICAECEKVFQEIDGKIEKSLRKLVKKPAGGDGARKNSSSSTPSVAASSSSSASIPWTESLKWPFKERRILLLRGNLDRLKSTLLLMLKVLTYGRMLKKESYDREAAEIDRQQIATLVRANQDANNRFTMLMKGIACAADSQGSYQAYSPPDQGVFLQTAVTSEVPGGAPGPKQTAPAFQRFPRQPVFGADGAKVDVIEEIKSLLLRIDEMSALMKVVAHLGDRMEIVRGHDKDNASEPGVPNAAAPPYLSQYLPGDPPGSGTSQAHAGTQDPPNRTFDPGTAPPALKLQTTGSLAKAESRRKLQKELLWGLGAAGGSLKTEKVVDLEYVRQHAQVIEPSKESQHMAEKSGSRRHALTYNPDSLPHHSVASSSLSDNYAISDAVASSSMISGASEQSRYASTSSTEADYAGHERRRYRRGSQFIREDFTEGDESSALNDSAWTAPDASLFKPLVPRGRLTSPAAAPPVPKKEPSSDASFAERDAERRASEAQAEAEWSWFESMPPPVIAPLSYRKHSSKDSSSSASGPVPRSDKPGELASLARPIVPPTGRPRVSSAQHVADGSKYAASESGASFSPTSPSYSPVSASYIPGGSTYGPGSVPQPPLPRPPPDTSARYPDSADGAPSSLPAPPFPMAAPRVSATFIPGGFSYGPALPTQPQPQPQPKPQQQQYPRPQYPTPSTNHHQPTPASKAFATKASAKMATRAGPTWGTKRPAINVLHPAIALAMRARNPVADDRVVDDLLGQWTTLGGGHTAADSAAGAGAFTSIYDGADGSDDE